ncbi:MAG TPA: hypothetical protein VGR31_14315 [Planctomycetota bacterium]|jgi:hypothetical protein|nr:hypothetical protein [Planctomycetota bacterium]
MKRRSSDPAAIRGPRAASDGEALLAEILDAPDRDRIPGARPVVSVHEQEDPTFLAAVEARRVSAARLSRRGTWHGEWAELEGPGNGDGLAELAARWHGARPIVLAGIASVEELAAFEDRIAGAEELHGALQEPRGLRAWLAELAPDLAPEFLPRAARARLFDEERDLERILFESVLPPSRAGRAPRGRKVDDLWVKSSWLSKAEGDASLRVRVSFGRERDDDASGDLLRHRLVAALAARLFPESALVSANPPLVQLVEGLIGEPALFTQHIAYWNAPEGGALFHHDAFAQDEEESARPGQLGVCYLQLSGRTAWLALSIEDLAQRVGEFLDCLSEGDLPWVRAQLLADATSAKRMLALSADLPALVRELARPGCGVFSELVNRGPEFTAWLADAGHAAILGPGDAILLPNHGIAHTAMHSVFCAGDDVAYSLSLAIRADREETERWAGP